MSRWIVTVGCLCCAVLIGAGFTALERYENTPGRSEPAPSVRPQLTRLPTEAGKPGLLVFAHPECSCTRATLDELARVLAQSPRPVSVCVLFSVPRHGADDWRRSEMWRQAAAIPGVQVQMDPDGVLARRFGAFTSGQTLLYGTDGRLEFRGGLTASRGHEGDNAGSDAVLALLAGRTVPRAQTPVFGCALYRGSDRERNQR